MKKKLLVDTFFYSIVQLSNFLIPLITLPYVTRIIGAENYGLLELAFVFSSFFVLAVKYGFEYSATRNISRNSFDLKKRNQLFWEYFYAKVVLLVVCILLFTYLTINVSIVANHKIVFFISFVSVVGDFLLPGWFLRGMGRVKTLAVFMFVGKLFGLPLIFLLIQEKEDFLFRVIITSGCHILTCLICFWYAIISFKIEPESPSLYKTVLRLKEGFPLFLSSVLILFSGNFNLIILENFGSFSLEQIGNYAAGQKVVQIIQNVVVMSVSQVFFPYFATLSNSDQSNLRQELYKCFILLLPAMIVGTVCLYYLSDWICSILFGSEFLFAAQFLQIFAILPFMYFVANTFLFQGVSNLASDKLVMYFYVIFAVLNLLGLLVVVESKSLLDAAYLRVAIQTAIAISSLVVFHLISKFSTSE